MYSIVVLKTKDTFYAAFDYAQNSQTLYYRNRNLATVEVLDSNSNPVTVFKMNTSNVIEKIGTLYNRSYKMDYYSDPGMFDVEPYYDNLGNFIKNQKSYRTTIYYYDFKNYLFAISYRYWVRGVGVVAYEYFERKNYSVTGSPLYLMERYTISSFEFK